MKKVVAIYIPNYNGAGYLRNVLIPANCECVVMDNNSTDDSIQVCRDRGFVCIPNNETVSRVDNWLRCIEHFRESDYQWLKWLFVGDSIEQEMDSKITEIAMKSEDAAIILFDYSIRTGSKTTELSWKTHFQPGIHNFDEASRAMLERGPFCAPICWMMSKKCNFEDLLVQDYSWAADYLLIYRLLKDRKMIYADLCVGCFNSTQRKVYSSKVKSYNSFLELMSVNSLVLREYRKEHPDDNISSERLKETIRLCAENHCSKWRDICSMQMSVFRAMVKLILKKNGSDSL